MAKFPLSREAPITGAGQSTNGYFSTSGCISARECWEQFPYYKQLVLYAASVRYYEIALYSRYIVLPALQGEKTRLAFSEVTPITETVSSPSDIVITIPSYQSTLITKSVPCLKDFA